MGTDIHGWVECLDHSSEAWLGVIKLQPGLADRDYELFAWLFGVRRRSDIPTRWDLPPLAAERGLPSDASLEAAADYARDIALAPREYYGASWVTWNELRAIDWDEPIEDRIIESWPGQQPHGTLYWRSQFLIAHADLLPRHAMPLNPGQHWTAGDKVYEVVAMRRRDVLEESWNTLFRLMEVLGKRYDNETEVRMVVWFDG